MAADIFWRRRGRDELIAWQLARLREFLSEKVIPFNAFFRERMANAGVIPEQVRGFGDLERIPLMSKQDIVPSADEPQRHRRIVLEPSKEALLAGMSLPRKLATALRAVTQSQRVRERLMDEYLPVHLTFTTGRSALATPVIYTKRDMELLKLAALRLAALVGIQRGHDTAMNVFPFAPHLAFWQTFFAGMEAGILIVSTGGGKAMGTNANLRLLASLQPTMLLGTPGYVYHLAHLAAEAGIGLSRLRTVVLGAERVNAGYREKLKQSLALAGAKEVRMLATYGFTEAKKAWVQSAEDGRYVLYPDMEIIEVIDPDTGRQVKEGEAGEVVYTMVDGSGSVVLRYRTGDMVRAGLVYEREPVAGRMAPLLGTDIARVSDIQKVKDTLIDFNDLFQMLSGHSAVREWQLELRKRNDDPCETDELWLKVALAEGADTERERRRLNSQLFARYELHFDRIICMSREELTGELKMDESAKELRIVDRRALPESEGRTAE